MHPLELRVLPGGCAAALPSSHGSSRICMEETCGFAMRDQVSAVALSHGPRFFAQYLAPTAADVSIQADLGDLWSESVLMQGITRALPVLLLSHLGGWRAWSRLRALSG